MRTAVEQEAADHAAIEGGVRGRMRNAAEMARTLDGEKPPEYVTKRWPGYGPDAVSERTGE